MPWRDLDKLKYDTASAGNTHPTYNPRWQYYGNSSPWPEDNHVYATLRLAPVTVGIDVDPWSTANLVKPASNDSIFVAVLGSSIVSGDPVDIDVTQIDPASLMLGPAAAPNIGVSPLYGDYDNDTNTDAVFVFKTQPSGIVCGDTEVILRGETFAGKRFEGSGTIVTTDCTVTPITFKETTAEGYASVFMAYDYVPACQAGAGTDDFGSVSAELSDAIPGCAFYGDFAVVMEATATVPSITGTRITAANSVTTSGFNWPFFLYTSAISHTSIDFSLDRQVQLEVLATGTGASNGGVLTGYSTLVNQAFPGGSTFITLPPGDYRFQLGADEYHTPRNVSLCIGSCTAAVDIDVDPWSAANIVKPESADPVAVAVLGSNTATGDATDFAVADIDPASLKLGPLEAPSIALSPLYGDYDGDGNSDAAFMFQMQATGIICEDTEVTLHGQTFGGVPFTGTDTITTQDCDAGGCHP